MGRGGLKESLIAKIRQRTALVAVIGLGYVGLPLCLAVAKSGHRILGVDVDPSKPDAIHAGKSYLKHIDAGEIKEAIDAGLFKATTDFSELRQADFIIVCVPTPLTQHLEPDLSYLEDTANAIAEVLRPGQCVIIESTTYPGTTEEVVQPILEAGGLQSGKDFYLAFSPEREDPGNANFTTSTIPKVVGADSDLALDVVAELYAEFIGSVVRVSKARVAEAVKLTENIFRAVNIALVNELKVIYEPMDIDIWEVIDAAKTKPFGFMPFYPGPGLGGHCIPIDPFYLTWKAREFDISTRFIELAGQINSSMPQRVVAKLLSALDEFHRKGLNGSRILVMGVAYKKNVDDMRESPSLKLIELLEKRGASIDFYDPFVPVIPSTRKHEALSGRKSVEWRDNIGSDYDAALIVTDHDDVDYGALMSSASLVVDTRNAVRKAGLNGDNLVLA